MASMEVGYIILLLRGLGERGLSPASSWVWAYLVYVKVSGEPVQSPTSSHRHHRFA